MLNFKYNPYKENIAIIGAAQSGKTTFGKKIASMLKSNGFNIIIFDEHRKFTDLEPFAVKRTLSEIRGIGIEIIQPFEVTKQFFADLCSVVYSFRNVVFICDELHNYVSKHSAPYTLDLLARNCNNRNVGYVAIFQAPSEVPSYIVRNPHHKFIFYLDLPTDIKYVKKWVSSDVEKFVTGEIPKYHAIYKKQGEKAEVFAA